MNVRPYAPSDYETIRQWWVGHHNTEFLPEHFLPKVGGIVDGLASWLLYDSGQSVYLLNWPVSNPEAGHESYGKAFSAIVDYFKELIPNKSIMTAYPQGKRISNILKEKDFNMVNEYNKEMIWGRS